MKRLTGLGTFSINVGYAKNNRKSFSLNNYVFMIEVSTYAISGKLTTISMHVFQLFSTLREKEPTFHNRIVTIEGDCSLLNLGISMTDKTTLIQNVSIVFHVAATVRFNEKIKSATAINVRSLKDAINLSKEMPKLKVRILSFTYVFICVVLFETSVVKVN